ncbi:MAG: 2Fe-2S iron-sulfur cluster-binding protein [Actinomycetota bacterium]
MRRLPDRGRVDHHHRVSFTWDGRAVEGLRGDTLASALLASGVRVLGSSVLMSRPRGVVTDGVSDPHAFAQVGTGDATEPLVRMHQVEAHDGLVAESRIHQGVLPTGADPDRFEKRHAHCDVLVAGGGPAGLAAALAAAEQGARVILVDDHPQLGGAVLGEDLILDDAPADHWVRHDEERLRTNPLVTVLTRTTAFNVGDQGAVALMERVSEHVPTAKRGGRALRRLWQVRTHQLVVATGATERPLVFADNDRPGVMLAGGVRGLLHRYGLVPERCVVFTTNDSAYRTAIDLVGAGVEVPCVVDVRPDPAGPLVQRARDLGVEVRGGCAVIGTDPDAEGALAGVRIVGLDGGGEESVACDVLAVSGGWDPLMDLHHHVGGQARWDAERLRFVPEGTVDGLRLAGAAAGLVGTAACRRDGHLVGLVAAEATGFGSASDGPAAPAADEAHEGAPADLVVVPGTDPVHAFVDQHRDVTIAGVERALGSGLHHVEHLKRYTLVGTGTEQGRTAKVNAGRMAADRFGLPFAEVGVSNARPPAQPVTFGSLAGRALGARFDPVRTTSIHPWHVAHGAVFEDVGQWKRPWYFPQGAEDLDAAVLRECAAVREAVGMMDASTLGKIDVKGADAGAFLDRLYTGVMSTLKPGRARYGVMCKADGMVMDDGVVLRLADDRFLVTTTTGGAAGVLDWMEDFLQTEWPDLDVWLTSVTEQWATVAVVGPRSRDMMAALAPDLDVTQDAFTFMQVEEAVVAGMAARVARISFSGELAFEISVPMTWGLALWEAVFAAGQPFGITPYGTESMHVLRAEKGYFIVGQETDGTVTPLDLGLDWMVADKEFVGRRSLRRSDMLRDDRKQLVGILPAERLPEGSQLVDDEAFEIPVPMIGHVTSSYESAALGRPFGLALVRRGRDRIGETIYAPLADRTVAVEIVDPVIFDQEGARRDG